MFFILAHMVDVKMRNGGSAADHHLGEHPFPQPDTIAAIERLAPANEGYQDMPAEDDERWMRKALALAKTKGHDPSDTPIAAIIVLNGKQIGAATNQTIETYDATAHAEMLAIRVAGKALKNMDLQKATLYSTLQPCGMCSMASIWAKVGRIVYGVGRDDVHRMYFEDKHLDAMDFVADAWRDDLSIDGGCLRRECASLYYGPDDDVPEEEQGNV